MLLPCHSVWILFSHKRKLQKFSNYFSVSMSEWLFVKYLIWKLVYKRQRLWYRFEDNCNQKLTKMTPAWYGFYTVSRSKKNKWCITVAKTIDIWQAREVGTESRRANFFGSSACVLQALDSFQFRRLNIMTKLSFILQSSTKQRLNSACNADEWYFWNTPTLTN